MRIAFVKQDVYLDLYVNERRCSPADMLFSSTQRVGPIGLFTRLDADFLIIREEDTPECRIWEKVIPHYKPEWLRSLKDHNVLQSDLPEAKFLQPGNLHAHSRFSVAADNVDWSRYDVVIGINLPVPSRIVKRHRNTLWCYMIGEANLLADNVYYGYDVCLNQETLGRVARGPGVIDFPYTFTGRSCLENIMRQSLGRASANSGIFIEINSIPERPAVTVPPTLQRLTRTGHPLLLHRQNIRDNLTALYDARYFVKVGGRIIRGNSVIEAISCGTLVLMNPAELTHSQLLPSETWVYSIEDVLEKISELDRNPREYQRLLEAQRVLLQQLVFDIPLESLKNSLSHKRSTPPPPAISSLRRVASVIKRAITGKHPTRV